MFVAWIKRFAWVAILVPIVAYTWWLQHLVGPAAPIPDHKESHVADYSMENATVTETSATGEPHYRLDAKFMEHYADDGSVYLRSPQVQLLAPGKPIWTLTAEEGTISADKTTVWLRGDVFIDRAESPTQTPLHVTTRDVLVRPREEYAETKEHVLMEDPLSTLNAVGMRIFSKEERLQMLAQARGRYAPR